MTDSEQSEFVLFLREDLDCLQTGSTQLLRPRLRDAARRRRYLTVHKLLLSLYPRGG